jgi:predicted ATPase
MGFLTVPEEGRRIIKEQILINGEGLPWKNKMLFARLMFEASVRPIRKSLKLPVFNLFSSIGEYGIP